MVFGKDEKEGVVVAMLWHEITSIMTKSSTWRKKTAIVIDKIASPLSQIEVLAHNTATDIL